MRTHRLAIRAAAGLLLFAGAPRLSAAAPGDYPAQTHWIINLDFKKAQASPLMALLIEAVAPAKRKAAEVKLAAFNAKFGVDLMEDIDQITLVGNGGVEQGGVAYIYGRADEQHFTRTLATVKQYASADHNGVAIQSWLDEGDNKRKYIAFTQQGAVLLSNELQPLSDAVDVLTKKQDGLPPGSPLNDAFKTGGSDILTLHVRGIATVIGSQPKAEVFKQTETLSLRITAPDDEKLTAVLTITATSGETAQQFRQALAGIQAIALLRAADAPQAADIASCVSITGAGRTATATLTLRSKNQLFAFFTLLLPHLQQPNTALAAP